MSSRCTIVWLDGFHIYFDIMENKFYWETNERGPEIIPHEIAKDFRNKFNDYVAIVEAQKWSPEKD